MYSSVRSDIGEVRILQVSAGLRQDPIRLAFAKAILDGAAIERFEAISYMWGSSQAQVKVQLDGCDFFISTRLHEVLLDIRDSTGPRFVWIDAICINQQDISERNKQVQLMRRIYRDAQVVRVWLDLKFDPNTPVFLSLKALNSESACTDLGVEPDFWDPVCAIFANDYWSRVWIQQEITNARELIIQCGAVLVETSCLFHFLRLIHAIQYDGVMGRTWWDWAVKKPSVQLPERFGDPNCRTMPVKGSTLDTNDLDIVNALQNARKLKCTDDRDRVYGIMFLAQNWHEGDITVDYTLSVSGVYTEASRAILDKYHSLGFLSYATLDYSGYGHITDKTPSWAPDWRRKPTNIQFAPRLCLGETDSLLGIPGTISDQLLFTRGVKLDKVAHCFSDSFRKDLLSFTVLEFIQIWDKILAAADSLPPSISSGSGSSSEKNYSESPQWRALIRTISGSDYRRSKHPDIDNVLYQSGINLVSLSQCQHGELDPAITKLGQVLNLDQGTFQLSRLLISFSWWMLIAHFPILTSLRRTGLAPKCAQPGDQIWFILTCEKPLILRPHGKEYLVVGEAYLDGMNHWRSLGKPQRTLQEGDVIGGYEVQPICLK
jgi:hypothetical protein